MLIVFKINPKHIFNQAITISKFFRSDFPLFVRLFVLLCHLPGGLDRVFGCDSTTKQVYEEGAKEVALSVVNGINCK